MSTDTGGLAIDSAQQRAFSEVLRSCTTYCAAAAVSAATCWKRKCVPKDRFQLSRKSFSRFGLIAEARIQRLQSTVLHSSYRLRLIMLTCRCVLLTDDTGQSSRPVIDSTLHALEPEQPVCPKDEFFYTAELYARQLGSRYNNLRLAGCYAICQ